ncbi:MAG: SLC13 family permease, partial [Alphaproteobacteria bacterium]|nr:SLC13 family permease [Alphaproteobacteria bacterium]
MTVAQGLSFALIGLMLVLFLWDRWRFDLVALLILLLAVAVGVLPIDKAFDGFRNPLLPLIASALVLSAAVRNSGVVEGALRRLRPLLRSHHAQVAVLVASVATLSALIKNIGALAIFLPVAMQVARRGNRPVSELLMPMSFASLVGGMITLIGTSPNLIISSVRQNLTGQPYAMFDFLPVGAGLTLVAIAFLSVGWRLLPRRRAQAADAPFRMEDYIGEAKLPKESNLVGKTVGELEALADNEVAVNAIIRQGDRRYIPAAHWRLYPDDLLVLQADPEDMHKLVEDAKLELAGKTDITRDAASDREAPEITTVEAVVTTNSPMIGRKPRELRLRSRHGVNLLAVRSGGQAPR